MDKMKLGVRLHWHNLMDDEGYKVLMDFCDEYKEQIDELSLFTHYTLAGYVPASEDDATCKVLAKRIADLRARGYKNVGLNMLSTIGHGDQPFAPMTDMPGMVGHDGYTSICCPCPTSDEFKAYTVRRYKQFSELKPDFMWVDDDNRFYHTGALYPCFCDRCIRIYNERYGHDFGSREELVAAIEVPENIPVRRDWIQFVEDRICDTFALVAKTVHSVDPNIETGYMSTGMLDGSFQTYNGQAFHHYLTALEAKKGRPGTTIFNDRCPMDLMVKPMVMAFQSEDYPEQIRDIVYEHENYPYPTYHKAHVWETAECTLALANGANGVYANTMDDRSIYCLDESRPFFNIIRRKRAMWDAMTKFSSESHAYGFYAAHNRNYDKRRPLKFGESFFTEYNGWARKNWTQESGNHDVRHALTLSEIGLPMTMNTKYAIGAVLAGDLVDGFTDDELKEMFKGGVMLDGYALRALEARGLGELTGVKLVQFWNGPYHEHLNLKEDVNRGILCEFRDTRQYAQEFGGISGDITVEPLNDRVRVVSWLDGFVNGDEKGICSTLYENELGGRVWVMGYSAFTMVDSFTRRRQVANIADWMSHGKLRAKLVTDCLAACYIREGEDNGCMVTIASLSMDGITNPQIAVYGAKEATFLGDDGKFEKLCGTADGDYAVFTLPHDIAAFDTAVIIAK